MKAICQANSSTSDRGIGLCKDIMNVQEKDGFSNLMVGVPGSNFLNAD